MKKLPFNPWPVAIIAWFVLFTTFTIGIVAYISHQKMDLVRGDYYDDEIRYQEQLDRMNRTQGIKDQVVVAYSQTSNSITVTLPATSAQASTHAPAWGSVSGRIRLYRPSNETLDQNIPLALDNTGSQKVDTGNLEAGLWKVRVYWTVAGQDYYFNQSIVVGAKHS